jgi:hypothetical protein
LKSFPDKFNAHIAQTQNWLAMKSSSKQTQGSELCPNAFEHPEFGDVHYDILTHDVQILHEKLPARAYTLALADIPYGFAVSGCLHDDNVAWGVEEISKMVQSFKVASIAKLWRIIIHHSIDQYEAVKTVLKAECNGGFQNCMW